MIASKWRKDLYILVCTIILNMTDISGTCSLFCQELVLLWYDIGFDILLTSSMFVIFSNSWELVMLYDWSTIADTLLSSITIWRCIHRILISLVYIDIYFQYSFCVGYCASHFILQMYWYVLRWLEIFSLFWIMYHICNLCWTYTFLVN